jgi:hypothetical protein
MPRKDPEKIKEIQDLCKESPWKEQLRTQDLAYHLLHIKHYERCDIIASEVVTRKQIDAVAAKVKDKLPLHHTGRYGILRRLESSLLKEWLLREMKKGRFHYVYEVRKKVCFPNPL